MENAWSISATQTERVDLDAMKIPQQLQRTLKSLYDLCHTVIPHSLKGERDNVHEKKSILFKQVLWKLFTEPLGTIANYAAFV